MFIKDNTLNILFLLILISHILISYLMGANIPWGGDEVYTYDVYSTTTGLPNVAMVMLYKYIIGPITASNYMIYSTK